MIWQPCLFLRSAVSCCQCLSSWYKSSNKNRIHIKMSHDFYHRTSPVSFALRNDAEDKERILRALKQANGNRKVAAELLGIGRTTLYSKLEEYGLKYKFQQS